MKHYMHLLHYFSKLNSKFGSVFWFCQITFYWLFKNCNSHLWKQIALNWFNTNTNAKLTLSSKYQRHSSVCYASFTCSFLRITASSSLWETPPWLLMAHRRPRVRKLKWAAAAAKSLQSCPTLCDSLILSYLNNLRSEIWSVYNFPQDLACKNGIQ